MKKVTHRDRSVLKKTLKTLITLINVMSSFLVPVYLPFGSVTIRC